METTRKRIVIIILLFVLAIAVLFGTARTLWRKETAVPEKVIFAVSHEPVSAPVYVALARGYFRDQGLEVTLQSHASGRDALDAVIRGKAHFATAAETPIMFAGLKGAKIYIIATIADSDRYFKIIGKRDRGISKPEDLSGKRIGVSLGTNGEFYLDMYLVYHLIPEKNVQVVDLRPEQMSGALGRGEIDAAAAWEPYAGELQADLGQNATVLFDEDIYRIMWNVAVEQSFAKGRPGTIRKALRALVKANNFIMENPSQSRTIIAQRIKAGTLSLDDYDFDVRLSQALLDIIDNQARWAILNRYADATTMPNLLNIIYPDGMMDADPSAVTVIHK